MTLFLAFLFWCLRSRYSTCTDDGKDTLYIQRKTITIIFVTFLNMTYSDWPPFCVFRGNAFWRTAWIYTSRAPYLLRTAHYLHYDLHLTDYDCQRR